MIESGTPVSFRVELFQGIHEFQNDTFKMALYDQSASLTKAGTSAYTTTGEISASGYTAGGVELTGATVSQIDGVAVVDFDDVTVTGTGMLIRAALIYNSSKSNRAVRIIDFGQPSEPETDPVIEMPSPTAESAILRM